MRYRWLLFFILFFFDICYIVAQKDTLTRPITIFSDTINVPNAHVHIKSIIIHGNKKTKDYVIFRELDFQVGDAILLTTLHSRLAHNRLLLMNTLLFTDLSINIKEWDTDCQEISIYIEIIENWYWYPSLIFELSDRNFNTWWHDNHRSLKRVNYGVSLYINNFTGQRDVLRFTAQDGFNRKYSIQYQLPSINKKNTVGMNGGIFYSQNKEVLYTTQNNRLQSYQNKNQFQINRFWANIGLNYRPRLFTTHRINFSFNENSIADTVAKVLNPDFFLLQRNRQRYFSFQYLLAHDRRDIRPFPTQGFYFSLFLNKEGIRKQDDIHTFALTANYSKYFSFHKKLSLELISEGKFSFLRQKQPYYNSRALGYGGDYLRGYELSVIDGLDYVYIKTSLRQLFLQKEINCGKLMPLPSLRKVPLRSYVTLNVDAGYANNPYYNNLNTFTNRLLYSAGVSCVVILYYDLVFSFEGSINHAGQRGFYVHFKNNF